MLRDAKQRREEWIFFKIKEGDQFLGSFSPFVASLRRHPSKLKEEEPCTKKIFGRSAREHIFDMPRMLIVWALLLSPKTLLVRLRCLTEKDLEEELELIAKKKCQEVCSMLGIRPGKVCQHVPACVSWGTRHFTTGISLFSPLKLLMLSNHEIQFWTHPLFEYWGFKGLFPAVRMLTFQPSR